MIYFDAAKVEITFRTDKEVSVKVMWPRVTVLLLTVQHSVIKTINNLINPRHSRFRTREETNKSSFLTPLVHSVLISTVF